MELTCLNCNHEFEPKSIYKDKMGFHAICPNCESSFDIDDEYPLHSFFLNDETTSTDLMERVMEDLYPINDGSYSVITKEDRVEVEIKDEYKKQKRIYLLEHYQF